MALKSISPFKEALALWIRTRYLVQIKVCRLRCSRTSPLVGNSYSRVWSLKFGLKEHVVGSFGSLGSMLETISQSMIEDDMTTMKIHESVYWERYSPHPSKLTF